MPTQTMTLQVSSSDGVPVQLLPFELCFDYQNDNLYIGNAGGSSNIIIGGSGFFVPYTGASSDLNLGAYSLIATEVSAETGRFGGSSNYVAFDSSGHLTFHGTARPFRDEFGDILAKKKVGAGITEDTAEGTLKFSDSCQIADDYVISNHQLNHDRAEGEKIYPHIHWFQTSSNVPNFLLQYRWQQNGATKVTSWTDYKCNTTAFAYTSGAIVQICKGSGITPPANDGLCDTLQFRLCRDTDNDSGKFLGTDPLSGDVHIFMFDVHIQIARVGSSDEYIA